MADTTSKKIIYKIEFNGGELDKQLKSLNKTLEQTKKEQTALGKAGKKTSDEYAINKQKIKEVSAEYRKVSQAIANTNKLTKTETGYLERKKAQLSLVTAQLDKMTKSEINQTSVGKKLLATRKQLNNELKQTEAAGGTFYRNVGNYPKVLGQVANGLKQVWGQMKFFLGITAIIGLFRNMINTIKEFEQQAAVLASVLGKTKAEIKDLTDLAQKLGATTQYTATQVLQLAEELARLGFNGTEIKAMTLDVLNLATALNTDLASAATLVGNTLRAYDKDATEAGAVSDAFAEATRKSALSFSKLSTALPIVGTTAKNAGVGLNTLTSQLAQLADRGLDASSSGTALRKIYLELSKQGITMADAMEQINSATDKNKASMNLFGIRAATAGVILADTTGEVEEFTKMLYLSAGAAEEMAEVQMDTLNGSILRLKSAWEGFILGMNDGTGVGNALKVMLGFLADNLTLIIKLVASAGAAFIGFRVATAAYTAALKVQQGVMFAVNGTIKQMITAFRALSAAQKTNIIGAIVAGLTAAIVLLIEFNKKLSASEQMLADYNSVVANEVAKSQVMFEKLIKANKGTEERAELIAQINEEYGEYLPNLLTEASNTEEVGQAMILVNGALKEKIRLQMIEQETTRIITESLEAQAKSYTENAEGMRESLVWNSKQQKNIKGMSEENIKLIGETTLAMAKQGLTGQELIKAVNSELIKMKDGQNLYIKQLNDYIKGGYVEEYITDIGNAARKEMASLAELNKAFSAFGPKKEDGSIVPDDDDSLKTVLAAQNYQLEQAMLALEKYKIEYEKMLRTQTDDAAAAAEKNIAYKIGELKLLKNIEYQKYQDDKRALTENLEAKKINEADYDKQKYYAHQKYLVAVANLENKSDNDIKQIKEKLEKEQEAKNKQKLTLQKQFLEAQYDMNIISTTQYYDELRDIEIEEQQKSLDLAKVFGDEREIILEAIRKKWKDKKKKEEEDDAEDERKRKLLADQNILYKQLEAKKITQIDYNKQMMELEVAFYEANFDAAVTSEEEKQKAIEAIRKKYGQSNIQVTEEENKFFLKQMRKMADENGKLFGESVDALYAKLEQTYQMVYSLALQYIDFMAQMQADNDARAMEAMQLYHQDVLDELESQNDKELRLLQYKLDSGQISEQEYIKAKLDMENNFADEHKNLIDQQAAAEEAARRKALEEQKKFQRASVIINAASAIIGTWSSYATMGVAGTILAGIQTAVIAASAAMQLSQIDSQTMAEGGLLDGPSHAQGGINYGTAEVEGGEFVTSVAATQAFYPAIAELNAAGNEGRTPNIIDYDRLISGLAAAINNKQVVLMRKDLVDDNNDRVNIHTNTTFGRKN